MSSRLSRRTVLRGLGAAVALPWLEAMGGLHGGLGSRAAGAIQNGGAAAGGGAGAVGVAGTPPVRLACVFMPNGVNYEAWAPTGEGAAYTLSRTLEPLAKVRDHFSVLTGLTLDKARANGDGPGDHARSSASFLTGRQARKTAGNDIHVGVSLDQFAARQVGGGSRLPSLELGCENQPTAGNCDSGYSCAYTSSISWRAEDAPMPKLVDPARVFERLFGDAASAAARRERLSRRASILDFVREDARRLESELGTNDRRKLDQFQTSVREIELRIERARNETDEVKPPEGATPPAGVPREFGRHVDLMYDMLLLAFQTDSTRVATFMLGVDGSNRTYPEIGIKEGHHHLSHHQNNQEMIEKIRRIDRFCMEKFAGFLERLAGTPEGEGSLLDNCMILHGGGISDGNRHNHENLPILLAGRGGGTLNPGRLVRAAKETPLCNLYLSLLDRMGCEAESFGDSTGRLDEVGL